jgi:hypothetical protein
MLTVVGSVFVGLVLVLTIFALYVENLNLPSKDLRRRWRS